MSAYSTARSRAEFWAPLGLIALLGMVLASATLGWSFRNDEPYTANVVHRSWFAMWEAIRSDNIFPLHFVLLWMWRRVFGESEVALRIPSLLAYVATIVVVGCTARRAADTRTGLLAALLMTVSTTMGHAHSGFARSYTLLGLMIASATHVTFTVLHVFPSSHSPSVRSSHPLRWHVILIVLHVLGLLTHPLYVFAMLALTVAALWVGLRAVAMLVLDSVAGSFLYLLVVGPFLLQTLSLPTTLWIPVPTLKDLGDGFLNLWGWRKTLLILGYALVLCAWRGRRRLAVLPRPVVPMCLVILALISLLPFLASHVKPVYVETRTPIMFLPIACVLVALIIGRLENRFVTRGVSALLLIASVLSAYGDWTRPDPIPARATLHRVVQRAQCGDVFVLSTVSISEVEYYFRRFNAPACLQLESFPLDTMKHPGWLDERRLRAHPDELEREAQTTVARLEATAKRVWLFYDADYYPEVGGTIWLALDRRLTLRERLDSRGSFFDVVLLYSP